MFLIFLVYFIISLTFILGDLSVKYIDPIALIAIRMVLSGTVISAYSYFKGYKFPNLKSILLLSLVHIALPFNFEFEAFKYTSACNVAFIFNLTPFVTGIIEQIFYKKLFTSKQWFAMALAFMATTFATLGGSDISFNSLFSSVNQNNSFCFEDIIGETMVFASVVMFAFGWIYIKSLEEKKYSILAINGSSMLGGGIAASIFAYFTKPGLLTASINPYGIMFTLILILLGNIISWNLYGYLLKKYPATFLALTGAITPVMVAVIEWFVYGKQISSVFILATIFIMIAIKIFLSNKDNREK